MIGSFLKGTAFCAMFGLATVGALTFVPEEAWDSFPAPLAPVRAELAKYGVAPARYRFTAPPATTSGDVAAALEAGESSEVQYAESDFSRRASAPRNRETNVRIGGRVASPNYEPEREDAGKSSAFDVGSFVPFPEEEAEVEPDPFDRGRNDSRFSETSSFDAPRSEEPTIDSIARNSALERDDFAQLNAPESTTGDVAEDEPFVGSNAALDEILVDREVVDPYAQTDPYATPEPPARVEASQVADDFPSNNDTFPSLDSTLVPAPNVRSAPRSSEPVGVPGSTEFVDAPLNTSSSDSDAAAPDQGYLPPNVDRSSLVSDNNAQSYSTLNNVESNDVEPAPQNASFQSYEEYVNSQTAALAQAAANRQAEQESNAGTAFIPETNAVLNTTQSAAPSLNELLESAATPRDEAQTRELFTSLNSIYRAQSATMSLDDRARLISALDRLAYEVFYDPTKAVLDPPRQVLQGETLATIAREYAVTPELLAAINNLSFSANDPLPAGRLLKVVRGPVTAELSTSKKELLLCFNGYYAGRFQFGLPRSAVDLRGQYFVDSKINKPSCDAIDATGAKVTIPGGAENNPLGACWIGLKDGPGLQGTNRPELVGTVVQENGGLVFSNQEISQLNILLPFGASVSFLD